MDLVTSGGASVFDLAFAITTEWKDPQPAIQAGVYDGKLVILNSEFDKPGELVDRGVAGNQYRFYAVAGTPHVSDHLEVPSFSSRSTPASFDFALRAHFLQGDRWCGVARRRQRAITSRPKATRSNATRTATRSP